MKITSSDCDKLKLLLLFLMKCWKMKSILHRSELGTNIQAIIFMKVEERDDSCVLFRKISDHAVDKLYQLW